MQSYKQLTPNQWTGDLSKGEIDKKLEILRKQPISSQSKLDIRFAKNMDINYLLKSIADLPLEFLSIRFCQLTDDDTVPLSTYITSNLSVEKLDLSNNKLTTAGAAILLQALDTNSVLEEIELKNNTDIKSDIFDKIRKNRERNLKCKIEIIANTAFPLINSNIPKLVGSYLRLDFIKDSQIDLAANECSSNNTKKMS